MGRIAVPQLIIKLEHSFIIRTAAILFGFGMLLTSITFVVWGTFFQSQTKILAGINYYSFPVIVTFDEHAAQIDAFESYSFSTDIFTTAKIEVRDLKGNLLTTRKHELSRSASISIDLLSDKDTAKQCFAQANVTDLFYFNSGATPIVTEEKVLTASPLNSYTLEVAAISSTTLYPGKYDGKDLPASVDQQQKIWGVYPVDCNITNDVNKMAQAIADWSMVTPDAQRDLYAQKVREIIDSPEYNH